NTTGLFILAMMIATGSTIQALAARFLIEKFMGLPLSLNKLKDVFYFLFLCGPEACMIAATIGSFSVAYAKGLTPDQTMHNWITWWCGDVLGILLFLPIVLLTPHQKNALKWRGQTVGALPLVGIFAICISVGLTFY